MVTKTNAFSMEFLASTLSSVLRTYHAPEIRYRHLAFSCKELALIDAISNTLQGLLPDFSVWRGNAPKSAPLPLTCSRPEFIHEVFDNQRLGLIIEQPHYWWLSWSITDRQAFWSALSARQYGYPVIVVFVENYEFTELNQHYFKSSELPSLPVKLWVSTKATLATQGLI